MAATPVEPFDVVILGAGSAAEQIWPALPGRRVAVVESDRVGGACPYIACMPSKSMLHDARRRRVSASPARGTAVADTAWREFRAALQRRDAIVEHLDDTGAADALMQTGAELVRGEGAIVRDGTVCVGERELGYRDLVIDTGSATAPLPVEGLRDVQTWTSDDALTADELPARLLVLGGGAVGCELAQVYITFGSQVTIVESGPRLLSGEDPLLGECLGDAFRALGIEIRTGTHAVAASPAGGGLRLELEDGSAVDGDRILIATGRAPRVQHLGLERIGVPFDAKRGIPIDDHCRVVGHEHVWAAGDVTGIAPFTHTAGYHGRVIAANLRGEPLTADHRAIPRTVFTDPVAAAVGMTAAAARDQGIDVAIATFPVRETARAATDALSCGAVTLCADRRRRVVVGAAAIAAGADEWISEMTLAIRAAIPVPLR